MSTEPVCPSCGPHVDETLFRLRTSRGLSAAAWLWAPAAGEAGHMVVGDGEVLVHTGTAASVRVHADAGALPVPSRSVPALVVAPVLAQRPDLDAVFAEMRRVLRPSGLITMLVPDGPSLGLRGRSLRSEVRALWAHRSAVDHPDWLLTAADFAVMGDDRLAVVDPGVRESGDGDRHVDALRTAALLPPPLDGDVRARLAAHPTMRAGRTTVRRLVARR